MVFFSGMTLGLSIIFFTRTSSLSKYSLPLSTIFLAIICSLFGFSSCQQDLVLNYEDNGVLKSQDYLKVANMMPHQFTYQQSASSEEASDE